MKHKVIDSLSSTHLKLIHQSVVIFKHIFIKYIPLLSYLIWDIY